MTFVLARGGPVPIRSSHYVSGLSQARVYGFVQWFRGGLVFQALVLLSLRLKDLLGPVTRVKKTRVEGWMHGVREQSRTTPEARTVGVFFVVHRLQFTELKDFALMAFVDSVR